MIALLIISCSLLIDSECVIHKTYHADDSACMVAMDAAEQRLAGQRRQIVMLCVEQDQEGVTI